MDTPVQPERTLAVTFRVELSRLKRRKCPVCRRLRVLYALTAFAPAQPIGYGEAKCLECAGIRRRAA